MRCPPPFRWVACWNEFGRELADDLGEPVVVGDPRHFGGVDVWSGEVDPCRVEGLPGPAVRSAVGGDDGPGRADVMVGLPPVGLVTLQLIQIGEDLAVEAGA